MSHRHCRFRERHHMWFSARFGRDGQWYLQSRRRRNNDGDNSRRHHRETLLHCLWRMSTGTCSNEGIHFSLIIMKHFSLIIMKHTGGISITNNNNFMPIRRKKTCASRGGSLKMMETCFYIFYEYIYYRVWGQL